MLPESYFLVGDVTHPGPFLVTCEHATNQLPNSIHIDDHESHLLTTHRGWDIGARDVATEIIRMSQSVGIFSNFSRLYCDPNRAINDPSWIPVVVDGHPVSFNQNLTPSELEYRLQTFHNPYHEAIERTIEMRKNNPTPFWLLSVHSYTPKLGDNIRTMEAGVLFDKHVLAAHQLRDSLCQRGLDCALNEPYSGQEGLIYSARLHGKAHDLLFLELELRQDLIDTQEKARQVAHDVVHALNSIPHSLHG